MSIFPSIDYTADELAAISTNLKRGKSFKYDFDAGEFIFKDGKLIAVTEIEAVEIWINKVLRTEKFKFTIYDGEEYGITIRDLIIGQTFPLYFLQSELKREITEVLETHELIDRIDNFEVDKDGALLTVSFTVILTDSNSLNMEVSL